MGDEEFQGWKEQRKQHILFFDGASKGNPWETSVGGKGIIYDPEGTIDIAFVWAIGTSTNNKAEALALYKGLVILKSKGVQIG
jgi:ribonuclease HI